MTVEQMFVDTDGQAQLVASLAVSHSFWDRADVAQSGEFEAPQVEDCRAALPQVLLSPAGLRSLSEAAARWLDDQGEFDVELGVSTNQGLDVAVGKREGLIYRSDRPALTVRYRAEAVELDVYFVVDQTNIAEMGHGVDRVIEALG